VSKSKDCGAGVTSFEKSHSYGRFGGGLFDGKKDFSAKDFTGDYMSGLKG